MGHKGVGGDGGGGSLGWKCDMSGVNSKGGGVMCTWVTKVSAARAEMLGVDMTKGVSREVVSMAAVGKCRR